MKNVGWQVEHFLWNPGVTLKCYCWKKIEKLLLALQLGTGEQVICKYVNIER